MKRKDISALVIEDDLSVGPFLKRVLGILGIHKTDLAQNEEQAIGFIIDSKYQLVLSDTLFGTSDPYGPRIVRRLKELGQNPVVIALSGLDKNKEYWEDEKIDYFRDKSNLIVDIRKIVQEKFPEE